MTTGLPSVITGELHSRVLHIAEYASRSTTADVEDVMRRALPYEVSQAVSNTLSHRNTLHAAGRGLPLELWREIWTELHFEDRISVSHVCRSWRTMSLSFASLWANITTAYSEATRCRHNADSIEPHPQLLALQTLLARSGASPVRLQLYIRDATMSYDDAVLIGDTLRTHADHIQSLHLRIPCGSHALTLVGGILPNMRTLDRLKLESFDFDIPIQSVLVNDAAPPALRFLELDGFVFDDSPPSVAFSTVTSLHYTATESPLTQTQLDSIFYSLPRLERLHLDLQSGWWCEHGFCCTPIPLAYTLRSVSLAIFSAAELAPGGVLACLQHTIRPIVALRFAYVCTSVWSEPHVIFDDLVSPRTLVLRRGFGARAMDERGFIREVYWSCAGWPDAAATMLLKRLAPTLRSLIVDAQLLPAISDVLATAPGLQHVTLRVSHCGDLQPAPLPMDLETLCVELVDMQGVPCFTNGRHRLNTARILELLSSSSSRRITLLRLAQVRLKKCADRTMLMRLREIVGAVEIAAFDPRFAEQWVVGLPIG